MKTPIPWLRVFIEGVVIVGSILMAFGIDAWWEGRQERVEEQQILESLRAEFQGHRSAMTDALDMWAEREIRAENLLRVIDSEDVPGTERMTYLIGGLTIVRTFDPGSGVRDLLITSGQLGLIENPDLRSRLSAWGGVVDEVRDNQVAMRDFVLNNVYPYLADSGIPIRRDPASSGEPWTVPPMTEPEAEQLYGRLLRDPGFATLLTVRYNWYDLDEHVEAIDFIDELLALIEAEIAGN